jgi:hypothetical protein
MDHSVKTKPLVGTAWALNIGIQVFLKTKNNSQSSLLFDCKTCFASLYSCTVVAIGTTKATSFMWRNFISLNSLPNPT